MMLRTRGFSWPPANRDVDAVNVRVDEQRFTRAECAIRHRAGWTTNISTRQVDAWMSSMAYMLCRLDMSRSQKT